MLKPTMRRSFLPVTFLLLLAPALLAQTSTTGDIAGTITDPAGGMMPAATILLKNNGTRRRTGDAYQYTRAHTAFRFCRRAPIR